MHFFCLIYYFIKWQNSDATFNEDKNKNVWSCAVIVIVMHQK